MKKLFYVFTTIILCLLASLVLHALIEMFYIKCCLSIGKIPQSDNFKGFGWCALPFWVQYSLPILGIVGGYFLGIKWWKIVYIEKRHWRNKIAKK